MHAVLYRVMPRVALASVLVIVGLAAKAGPAATRSDPLPHLDIETTCRDQARYAFAATLGQVDLDKEFAACLAQEQAMRVTVAQLWANASADQRRDCVALSRAKYSTLRRCLDGTR